MKKTHGFDYFQRINFLYQISRQTAKTHPALSAYYGNLIINIAKKNVSKIHPDMKRQICKKCCCMLIDKITAKITIRTKHKSKFIQWTCKVCGKEKKYPADKNKDHKIWLEKPEAIVEVIN